MGSSEGLIGALLSELIQLIQLQMQQSMLLPQAGLLQPPIGSQISNRLEKIGKLLDDASDTPLPPQLAERLHTTALLLRHPGDRAG